MERIGEFFIWLVIVLGGAALSIGSYQADAPKFFGILYLPYPIGYDQGG